MYSLLAKLSEIVASFGKGFLDDKNVQKDADVTRHIIEIVIALEELCVRGERVLKLAESMTEKTHSDDDRERFEGLLEQQSQALGNLQGLLDRAKPLLATVDVQFYLYLAPLLDEKSGLLTRWSQQMQQSRFSTTTLFFLPTKDLEIVLDIGTSQATSQGLGVTREKFVLAVAHQLRTVRSQEIRDIRQVSTSSRTQLLDDISTARGELEIAKNLCRQLLDSTKEAMGQEAFAKLRRDLLPHSPGS